VLVLHREFTREHLQDSRACEVATISEVSCRHHVLGVEHLLSQLRDSDITEAVRATAGERCESDHEEVKTREGNHVDGQFPQVRVELTRET